jgi:hypothetical protein
LLRVGPSKKIKYLFATPKEWREKADKQYDSE